MADNSELNKNIISESDTLDINELAALNNDISPEFIEQLQNQVSINASKFTDDAVSSDGALFEEVTPSQDTITSDVKPEQAKVEIKAEVEEQANVEVKAEVEMQAKVEEQANVEVKAEAQEPQKVEAIKADPVVDTHSNTPAQPINIDENIDDNFIKKYKAKLNKQQQLENTVSDEFSEKYKNKKEVNKEESKDNIPIENLSGGNIVEKPITKEQLSYNDSLDLLDNNVKYSKYVIYIDPENTEFIESLTVKERKNLINKIIREQDDIALTKRRLGSVQTIIRHAIIAILTISLFIPVIYIAINASLESTIDNYRRSQTIFQTLYKEHGKIKNN